MVNKTTLSSFKVLYMPSACSKSKKPKKPPPPIVDLDGDNVDLSGLEGKPRNEVNEKEHQKLFDFSEDGTEKPLDKPRMGILVSIGKSKQPKEVNKEKKEPEPEKKPFTVRDLDIAYNVALKAALTKGVNLEKLTLKEIGILIQTALKWIKEKKENPQKEESEIELSEAKIIKKRTGAKNSKKVSKLDMAFPSKDFILSLKEAKKDAVEKGGNLQNLSYEEIWSIFQSAFKIQQNKLGTLKKSQD